MKINWYMRFFLFHYCKIFRRFVTVRSTWCLQRGLLYRTTADNRPKASILYLQYTYITYLHCKMLTQLRLILAFVSSILYECVNGTNPCFQSLLNGGNLLRYHRQHFHVDSIKLVKTGPSTGTIEERNETTAI